VALGLIAGTLVGVALALARDATDRTVRDRDTLTKRSGLPTLAQLPQPAKEVSGKRSAGRTNRGDLVFDEGVRRLRSALLAAAGTSPHSVLVTAPVLGQGVTTTALQLALALTEVDENVLLIEGDPRQPAIAGLLGVEPSYGLADVLADQQTLDDAVQNTSHQGLWVLASSTPATFQRQLNPGSLATVLEKLRGSFDRVVIDGPPALATADAGILASATDSVVLVVRAGRTTVDEVDASLENLRVAGGNVIGAVLTGAPMSRYAKAATTEYRVRVSQSTSAALRGSVS
jgi:capsular exopolysaccharide synthesis family protein